MVRRTFEQRLDNLLAWPGEDAKGRLLPTGMVGGLLIPSLHQLGHLRDMFLIQRDEDDRVGPWDKRLASLAAFVKGG
jgi:hypothetical protein